MLHNKRSEPETGPGILICRTQRRGAKLSGTAQIHRHRLLHSDFEQRYGRAVLTIRAMTGGARYAQRHLEHSDYYDEHRRVQGEWQGRGAELLGLRGKVTGEQFEAVREGLHPETGEFLRPRHSVDRVNADGSEQSKARSLYDLTFSAPKSVSVQAMVGGDERLIAAHEKSVREALAEAESYASSRVRMNGANENRATGNWIVAAYRHDTSRELDPQLHTHAVAANLTYDGLEGRWKALQASGLYERRAYLTEVYRNALAKEVRGLGYEIEQRRDSRGRDHGFEIRGVADELLERYSQRSAQRDAAIEEFKEQRGRKPTDNEVAVWFANRAPTSSQRLPRSRSDNSNKRGFPLRNYTAWNTFGTAPRNTVRKTRMKCPRPPIRCNTPRTIFSSGVLLSTITNC